jgi:hypothetical protein
MIIVTWPRCHHTLFFLCVTAALALQPVQSTQAPSTRTSTKRSKQTSRSCTHIVVGLELNRCVEVVVKQFSFQQLVVDALWVLAENRHAHGGPLVRLPHPTLCCTLGELQSIVQHGPRAVIELLPRPLRLHREYPARG